MAIELEYDRSIYGKEHVAGPFEVTHEQVRAFAESLGVTDPVCLDERRQPKGRDTADRWLLRRFARC